MLFFNVFSVIYLIHKIQQLILKLLRVSWSNRISNLVKLNFQDLSTWVAKARLNFKEISLMRKVFPSRSFQVLRVLFVYFLVFPSKTVWHKRILAIREFSSFIIGLLGPMLYLIYPFFCLFSKFIFRFSNFQTGSQ